MACKCGACKGNPQYQDYWSMFFDPKEDQKAQVESQPTLDQSFESRVISLAQDLFDNKRNLDSSYGWGNAIADAITILTVTEDYLD